jgi:hypothetical protein
MSQLVKCQLQAGSQGHRVGRWHSLDQDRGGLACQQCKVLLGAQTGLLQIGDGLGDRQWQVIHGMRDSTGITFSQAWEPLAQQTDRLAEFEHVDSHRRCQVLPVWVS